MDEERSFNILYGPDLWDNVATVALYIDRWAKTLGLKALNTDPQALTGLASALLRADFPHSDGVEKASPFKKAAHFYVWFVAQKPIIDEIPASLIGDDLACMANHQNAIFAYQIAIDCLEGATLYRNGDDPVILSNRIGVSFHFFRDFIEAYGTCVPQYDFKKVSLLFEQLAYKANPGCSYLEVM